MSFIDCNPLFIYGHPVGANTEVEASGSSVQKMCASGKSLLHHSRHTMPSRKATKSKANATFTLHGDLSRRDEYYHITKRDWLRTSLSINPLKVLLEDDPLQDLQVTVKYKDRLKLMTFSNSSSISIKINQILVIFRRASKHSPSTLIPPTGSNEEEGILSLIV